MAGEKSWQGLDLPVSRILTVQVVVQLVLSGSLISANLYVFLFFFFFFETRFFEEEKDAMDRLNSFNLSNLKNVALCFSGKIFDETNSNDFMKSLLTSHFIITIL